MRHFLLSILALSLGLTASAKDVFVNTPKTTLMLAVNEGQTPRIHYYGSRIRPAQAQEIYDAMSINYDAYPAFGRNSYDETALSVTHADGNMSTELAITGSRQEGDLTIISLKDKKYDFLLAHAFPYMYIVYMYMRYCVCEMNPSEEGRTVDAWALTGDEGRDKLRKSAGRCK